MIKTWVVILIMVIAIMLDLGFLMRGEIIWDKSASGGGSCAWGSWMSASNPVLRDYHENFNYRVQRNVGP